MEEIRWKEKIKPLDENAMEEARAHWMTVGKPLFSLGSLEDAVIQIAGIKGTSDFELLASVGSTRFYKAFGHFGVGIKV